MTITTKINTRVRSKICLILMASLPLSSLATEIVTSDLYVLISDIHDYYQTSCVFMLHNDYSDMQQLRQLRITLRRFSTIPVYSVSMDFASLNTSAEFYYDRIVRPLYVVVLTSDDNVEKFAKLSEKFSMAFPVWFLLFDDKLYDRHIWRIREANAFHLDFNVEMFVKKYNSPHIEEWYALVNKVRILPIASWNATSRLMVHNGGSLYQRRTSLENVPMTVTTLHNPPMVTFNDSKIGGLFGSIVLELARVNHFNATYVIANDAEYGRWNSSARKWTGMMGLLASGEASLGGAEFRITTQRFKFVDFTLPLISTRDLLFIRQPEGGILWSGYWQALSPGIWIVIGSVILLTTILLTIITAVKGCRITCNLVSEHFLILLGIYCQQGLADFPESLPLRIAYFSVFVSSLVVSAAYSASLISYLTVKTAMLPFTDLEGFAEDGTYELIVFQGSAEYDMFATSRNPVLAKMFTMMKDEDVLPINITDGFQQVCDGKVAFYTQESLKNSISLYLPCKVVSIDTKLSISLGMAMAKNNPYFGLINYQIQRFQDGGILDRLKHIHAVTTNPPLKSHQEVTLWGVAPILAVLGVGVVLAFISLFIERICLPGNNIVEQQRRSVSAENSQVAIPTSNFKLRMQDSQPRFQYYLP